MAKGDDIEIELRHGTVEGDGEWFRIGDEKSDNISVYAKLPNWFKIPTPIGNYNPDWALIFEEDSKIYFVAETKDTGTSTVDWL